jgi:glycosyltransferase involved in cell wall biosynthesis
MVELKTDQGEEIDLVIATRFPSYLVQHHHKVVWLLHQYRQAYDLDGTEYGRFSESREDRRTVEMIRAMDRRGLGEARAIWANSRNVARRLMHYCGLESEPLYHPPKHEGRYRCGSPGDYVFAVGRLDELKRFDLVLEAMAAVETPCRCRIAGDGPERERLEERVRDLGLTQKIEFLGRVSDEELLDLYAECLAVVYPPYDEDYGYVTLEAFRSGKPVITSDDSGGILEFVEDGVNGYIARKASARQMAQAVDRLFRNRELALSRGRAGRERVEAIGWDDVVAKLTGTTRS